MIEKALKRIIDSLEENDRSPQPGVTDQELKKFLIPATDILSYEFPNAYLFFLKVMNGINYNGFFFYGVDRQYLEDESIKGTFGMIQNNLEWYELPDNKQYVFYGTNNSVSFYVYDRETKGFFELTMPSQDVIQKFDTFNDMLTEFIETCLL